MISLKTIAKAKEYCLCAYDNSKISSEEKLESELGIEGFFHYEKQELFICFAGSNEPKDWLLNLNFFTKNNYHQGIARGFHSIRKQLWQKVFNLDISSPEFRQKAKIEGMVKDMTEVKVYLTGHSLGGAIALLCALDLANHGFRVNLITFGQPKIVKRIPKINRIKFYIRVVNLLDLVTHAPCWFKHLPGKVIYKNWLGNPHNIKRYY